MTLRKAWNALLDLIAPKDLTCELCGSERDIVPDTGLCSKCLNDLEQDIIVKRVYRQVMAYAPLVHTGAASHLVYGLKFGGRGYDAYVLSHFMKKAVGNRVSEDVILIPVPQHWTRYLRRGFNPAKYLADELSKRLDCHVVSALKKLRRTAHQTGLDGAARQENLRNAFAVKEPSLVQGKHVLLVDDVLTTGATCRACTIPLLLAGAASVICVTATCSSANIQK